MSKSKNTVALLAERIARNIVAEQTKARIMMSFDAAAIAAHEVFGMGPGRAAAYANAYNGAMNDLAELYITDADGDKSLEYAKAKRDELILSIVGEANFMPFDKAYGAAYVDELKRVRILQAALPLALGDEVFFLIDEQEEFVGAYIYPRVVTGVGYRGFCVSGSESEQDAMDDFNAWSRLGQDVFSTRAAAEQALRKERRA